MFEEVDHNRVNYMYIIKNKNQLTLNRLENPEEPIILKINQF